MERIHWLHGSQTEKQRIGKASNTCYGNRKLKFFNKGKRPCKLLNHSLVLCLKQGVNSLTTLCTAKNNTIKKNQYNIHGLMVANYLLQTAWHTLEKKNSVNFRCTHSKPPSHIMTRFIVTYRRHEKHSMI